MRRFAVVSESEALAFWGFEDAVDIEAIHHGSTASLIQDNVQRGGMGRDRSKCGHTGFDRSPNRPRRFTAIGTPYPLVPKFQNFLSNCV